MNKAVVFSAILTLLLCFGFSQHVTAQEKVMPPLLLKQQNVAPASLPPAQGTPPPLPGIVPPSPGPGIPVVQTIPTHRLLANLMQAVATVQELDKLLMPGKVWMMRSPGGEIEIKAGILYQGVVVAVLHFNPLNGSVLPLGVNPHTYQNQVQIQTIKTHLLSVIKNLRILPVAEFMEPEACWSFPIAMDNTIVAHIKVYYDGVHVVQDYVANQEMLFYGQ